MAWVRSNKQLLSRIGERGRDVDTYMDGIREPRSRGLARLVNSAPRVVRSFPYASRGSVRGGEFGGERVSADVIRPIELIRTELIKRPRAHNIAVLLRGGANYGAAASTRI